MTTPFSPSEELYTLPKPPERHVHRSLSGDTINEKSGPSSFSLDLDPLAVPGYPLIPFEDDSKIQRLIRKSLCTKKLDKLYRFLSLVSTKTGCQIFPLHVQKVRGHEIVITEDHQLHLVWHYDRYFVKPIPEFLLNHLFWEHHLIDTQCEEYRAALGFVRSWSYLIKTQTDFDIAIEKRLLRWNIVNGERPDYEAFKKLMRFLSRFHHVQDKQVSRRYRYGELCLSRLNFWSRVTFTSRAYHRIYGQYGALLSYIITPLLFSFAVLSVVLAALQVELAAEQAGTVPLWVSFGVATRWFSFTALGISVVSVLVVFAGAAYLAADEMIWAIKHRGRDKLSREEV
ncbi:hypothetical protein H072_9720 [Dactylellina haptotyla CBS 200.50]|uniref:Uncharacterized protein n=1 Tax=Dactylellina haptotyla (strain CBS 200.50) TaxID=1284197 RepID=S8BBZ8_DACHA|nr:hypothetical protein H072_9720 [Dactylellina haptotyla CBS 200.50]